MITLYGTSGCKECAQLEEMLSELSLAHKLVWVEEGQTVPELVTTPGLPAMEDEHELITGHREIMEHIDKLHRYEAQWYKYQSDVCYVDDDESFWE